MAYLILLFSVDYMRKLRFTEVKQIDKGLQESLLSENIISSQLLKFSSSLSHDYELLKICF